MFADAIENDMDKDAMIANRERMLADMMLPNSDDEPAEASAVGSDEATEPELEIGDDDDLENDEAAPTQHDVDTPRDVDPDACFSELEDLDELDRATWAR